jgi:hypothetical protein
MLGFLNRGAYPFEVEKVSIDLDVDVPRLLLFRKRYVRLAPLDLFVFGFQVVDGLTLESVDCQKR